LGYGTVFAVNTNGTGFTNLYNFTGTSTGANPHGGLTLSGSTLYGATSAGGSVAGSGTVFAISTSGIGITNLHKFVANTDGSNPYAGLVLSGNTLYGTASSGGSGQGTLFRVNTDSTSFTNLHNFTYINDGAFPQGDLILSGNTLYGTTANGGTSATGNGTVFAINTDGTGFTNLYSFTAMAFDPNYTPTNSDGANPYAGLVLSGNTLYGTTSAGGMNGSGTVFAVQTDGTGFTNLYTFTALDPDTGTNSDGANSRAGLVLSSNTLYGTASSGGVNGNGMVFSLSLGSAVVSPPQLTINLSGSNVLLTWLRAGFILQSTTNLALPVWMTVPGQNTVTNPISGIQKFYRLSQ
jgi:uncharacterized repeat protein (TIGR03803 family)